MILLFYPSQKGISLPALPRPTSSQPGTQKDVPACFNLGLSMRVKQIPALASERYNDILGNVGICLHSILTMAWFVQMERFLTRDQAGDNEGKNQHLEHPHQQLSREGKILDLAIGQLVGSESKGQNDPWQKKGQKRKYEKNLSSKASASCLLTTVMPRRPFNTAQSHAICIVSVVGPP